MGFYFEFFDGFYIMAYSNMHKNALFVKMMLFSGRRSIRSSLCISTCVSIDGTVHQADFDSHAWFVAMTLLDHFLSLLL